MRMRVITAVDMRATARTGSRDSAAATTVISAPTMAKNTLVTAASTVSHAVGAKPPPLTRLLQVGAPVRSQAERPGRGRSDERHDRRRP